MSEEPELLGWFVRVLRAPRERRYIVLAPDHRQAIGHVANQIEVLPNDRYEARRIDGTMFDGMLPGEVREYDE